MNYTLKQLLDLFDLQEVNISKFIKDTYNNIIPNTFAISSEKADTISKILRYMLNHMLNSESVFNDADKGINIIKSVITTHILAIVLEYERVNTALSEDLMTTHNQEKFNPIDNDDINKAPIMRDNTTFTSLDNFNAKIEVMSKSSVIEDFLADMRSILRTMF